MQIAAVDRRHRRRAARRAATHVWLPLARSFTAASPLRQLVVAEDHGEARARWHRPCASASSYCPYRPCRRRCPRRRRSREQADRRRLGRRAPSAPARPSTCSALGRVDQHRQPLDPGRPADRRRGRPAERLDQPVIAPAAEHRALRAEPIGDELERGVAVIIEPAHQPRVARPGDARRIEPAPSPPRRSAPASADMIIVDRRRGVGDRPVARILAVEDAQRVARQPLDAVLATAHRDAPRNARPAPRATHRASRRRPAC